MGVLRRLGNKSRMAKRLIPNFPAHRVYIEPFFGAGGMFFNKRKAPHNFLNDMDSEVFNLWMVIKERRNMKNRRREILATSYEQKPPHLFRME